MDQDAPGTQVTTAPTDRAGQHAGASVNGLGPHVAAVRAARERLGRDLDVLDTEVREQIGFTVEKVAWRIAAAGAGILAGLLTRKALTMGWRRVRHGSDPPVNPAAPGTGWGEAVAWTVATAIGAGVARLIAYRGAAEGWRRATGHLPPGIEEILA